MRAQITKRIAPAILSVAVFLAPLLQAPAAEGQSKSSASAKKKHKTKGSKRRGRRERGQKAPTKERITEIQQALAKDGSYRGTPSGKWDAATVEAMKRFQNANGLNPTGKLDARTLQKLGLGSEITGVASPLQAATTSPAETQAARRRQ